MKRSRVAVGAVAIVAAMAFGGWPGAAMGATGGDWPQQRYSATQNPYNPAETAISAANVATLHAVWTRQFAAGKAVWAPIVSGGHLYSLITGGVISMNATTGKTRWRIQLAGVSGGGLAAAGGTLYVTTANGVHALDAATGSELWVFPLLIGSAAPVVANGIVYVGTNSIYALDAATGAKLWSFDTVWGDSTPIASNGIVYARRASDVVALDAVTGAVLWTVHDMTPLMVYKNTLFAYYDRFYAVDATTGAIRWGDAPLVGG